MHDPSEAAEPLNLSWHRKSRLVAARQPTFTVRSITHVRDPDAVLELLGTTIACGHVLEVVITDIGIVRRSCSLYSI